MGEDIKKQLFQKAGEFALRYDEEALRSNDIRMKAPMLFILLGDKVQDGLNDLKQAVQQSMSNSDGIVYLAVDSKKIQDEEAKDLGQDHDEQGMIYIHLEEEINPTNRGKLSTLVQQDQFLKLLNEQLSRVTKCILEKNKVFSCWEQMHVSVITRASDPINVLLPDLMTLLKNKLEQSFKQVFTDLFIRLEETSEDATPLHKALSYSFFRELDRYQQKDYHYEKATELVDDDMKLTTSYHGPLFHLVYLLSDQKENGQKINDPKKTHYETIVAVNLLKNRQQKSMELEEAREQYSYNTFMSNIETGVDSRYCTARIAKVRKPGQGIYLTVVYCLFKAYKKGLSYEGQDEERLLLEKLGLSDSKLEELVRGCMPSDMGLGEIRSLITTGASFKDLRSGSFVEAEKLLFGETAKEFFRINFTHIADKKLESYLSQEYLKQKFIQEVVSQPEFGPYALEQLLKSDSYTALEAQKEKYIYQIEQYKREIEDKENSIVGQCVGGNFSLFEKKYIQEVKSYLVEKIYRARYHYEVECLKLRALETLQTQLKAFYEELKKQLKKLDEIEILLAEMIETADRYEEEYLVQNVKEYYERVVQKQLEALQSTRGTHFLQESKYIGSSDRLLEQSKEDIMTKIGQIAEQEFLKEEAYFNVSFEEELLSRANMLVEYEDTEIAAKSELYKLLYESLEDNSTPCVYLDTTLASHRYIEKYFFGNRQSEFIDYAYKRDQSSRSYKIGTVNDKRKSVIEKLQIMGGFRLEDLVYSKSAKRYYEAYQEKGYVFHGEEIGKNNL